MVWHHVKLVQTKHVCVRKLIIDGQVFILPFEDICWLLRAAIKVLLQHVCQAKFKVSVS